MPRTPRQRPYGGPHWGTAAPFRLSDEQRDLAGENVALAYHLLRKNRLRDGAAGLEFADAAQESLYALCYSASRYDPERGDRCRFSSYAGYAVKKRLAAAKKSAARRAARVPPPPRHVGFELDAVDARLDVHAALARLRKADATLLRRYYLESCPFETLRAEAGVTREALRLRLRAARLRLRKILEGGDDAGDS